MQTRNPAGKISRVECSNQTEEAAVNRPRKEGGETEKKKERGWKRNVLESNLIPPRFDEIYDESRRIEPEPFLFHREKEGIGAETGSRWRIAWFPSVALVSRSFPRVAAGPFLPSRFLRVATLCPAGFLRRAKLVSLRPSSP